MNNSIYEIAILARATWNMHSLNNEGSIGNVIEPRTLKLADGSTSDGVSGEMLKHIHVTNVWELEADKSKFCEGCKKIDPTRAEQNRNAKSAGGGEAMSRALKDCILCDLHGFLVQKPTIHRNSTVQFGWAVTLRDKSQRDIHQHARHAVGEVEKEQPNENLGKGDGKKKEFTLSKVPLEDTLRISVDGVEQIREDHYDVDSEARKITFKTAPQKDARVTAGYAYSTTSQMLFSRPTRSGVYAIVTLLQPWRIGLNTIGDVYEYAIESSERLERYQLALRAYQTMFWRTDGSMTSTRLPHLESFEGVIVASSQNLPVPVVSPLNENYREEAQSLSEVSEIPFECISFNNLTEFVTQMKALATRIPYDLTKIKEKSNG